MAATALRLTTEPDRNVLKEQMDLCRSVTGRTRKVVEDFLNSEKIYSLSEIDACVKADYRAYIDKMKDLPESKRIYYYGLLDQVKLAWLVGNNRELAQQAGKIVTDRTSRNKVLLFLLEHGITDCTEIDYGIRHEYEKSLVAAGCLKVCEYVKALDILKLESIRLNNEKRHWISKKLPYEDKKIFLLYHPDYQTAMSFYYVRNKEELVYDFSVDGFDLLKKQVYQMLCHVLEEDKCRHDRRERFLIPLKALYLFCIRNGIQDLEELTEKNIAAFREFWDGKAGSKTDTYMQIIYNVTRYLFLSSKNTNWNANIWYLERFSFKDGRENPSRKIGRFTFGEIGNEHNRSLFKDYMKYEIGLAQRISLQTVRCRYYDLRMFFKYCDMRGWDVKEINGKRMEEYIKVLDNKDIQADAYNRSIISIGLFYEYIRTAQQIDQEPFPISYYLKKVRRNHTDRTVTKENQVKLLSALKTMPMHIRLMCLNLWTVGLRESEVCSIKAGNYNMDGDTAWLRIYQTKLKTEKCIPIPTELYCLMESYIIENHFKADEYVFQSTKGGAYDAGTFSKQVKSYLKKAGVTDYDFRSHDFRHTVATAMYMNYSVPVEVIRDYLGHKNSDMTRQYIDYLPDLLDKKDKDYFSVKENNLLQCMGEVKNE